jgi:hypothetical protein
LNEVQKQIDNEIFT